MNTLINNNESNYFSLFRPNKEFQKPFIISSAHSGTKFPKPFNSVRKINHKYYKSMQDMHVNDLSLNMRDLGITILQNNISRLVIDHNREINELDPSSVIGVPKNYSLNMSSKTRSGIGLIPTNDSSGSLIYDDKLLWNDVENRIKKFYNPWHNALKHEIHRLHNTFGYVFLIDLHSMPSKDIYGNDLKNFIIGNNFDKTSSADSRIKLSKIIKEKGYSFSFNHPYSGGFISNNYSNLKKNIECIQIEISKKLYMSEVTFKKNDNYNNFKSDLNYIIKSFMRASSLELKHDLAAE